VVEMTSVYLVNGDHVDTLPAAAGPWNPRLQHGGGPAALVAWAAEQMPFAEEMDVARLTLDLMRPVPVGPLRIERETVRQGRKISACTVHLLADDAEVVRASVLKIRPLQQEPPATSDKLGYPQPEQCPPVDNPSSPSPFLDGVSMRLAATDPTRPGARAIWFRLDRPIIDGQQITPLMRAAVTADFANGTSAALDPRSWSFINGDLSLHVNRAPSGDWILLDAETWLGPGGRAIAAGRLADRAGYFARCTQSLLVEPRADRRT
jgi:hypothetical protein